MKTGDFVTITSLKKEGYHFHGYFAYCLVYLKDSTYLFIDNETQIIKSILISEK